MVSKCNAEKIRKYLLDNNYLDVYISLILSLDNLRNRADLLSKNIDRLTEKLDNVLKTVAANPDKMTPENRDISTLFKDLQYCELEVIQKLNILTELLAVYHNVIRTDLRELPKAIGVMDFPPSRLHKEFDYFNTQKLADVWANFRYPDVDHFTELSSEERKILGEILEESASKILEAFGEIVQFKKSFRTIYNKYKHTLAEVTGIFGLDKKKREVQIHIYIRHKGKREVSTYIIPVTMNEARYFSEIASRVYHLLKVLIDNALLYLVNEGKYFIPRTVFSTRVEFTKIAEKVTSCVMPNFVSKTNVKAPTDQKQLVKINKELQEHHIFRMDKDILDLDALLKGGVALSSN